MTNCCRPKARFAVLCMPRWESVPQRFRRAPPVGPHERKQGGKGGPGAGSGLPAFAGVLFNLPPTHISRLDSQSDWTGRAIVFFMMVSVFNIRVNAGRAQARSSYYTILPALCTGKT
eukprot:705011-Prorocentrum_minimum.AAC.2